MNIRKYVTAWLATVVVVALCGLYGCASCSREMKSINSDVNGGIERTVTLYDYNGTVSSTLNRTTKRFSSTMSRVSA